MNTKLIIVEGLPGAGKSSTAQFISTQLNRNNKKAKWFYEIGLVNPLDYCYEAYLDKEDYLLLLNNFTQYETILKSEVFYKYDKYIFNYIILERKYKNNLPKELIDYLEQYDISNLDTTSYMDIKLEKWKSYFLCQRNNEDVTVIESSLLQAPIVELLFRNVESSVIKQHIKDLILSSSSYNPTLVYFNTEDVESEIKKMFNFRGQGFTNYVISKIEASTYGKNQTIKGIDLAMLFFKQYHKIAFSIFNELKINKLSINNSIGNWNTYYDEITKFLNIENIADVSIPLDVLKSYTGKYHNTNINKTFIINFEENSLYFYINETYKERLIPINNNSFNLQGSTLDIVFIKNEKEDCFMISGSDTASNFGQCGLLFKRCL